MGQTRNLRDGQIQVKDGAGSPVTITLTLEKGDLKWARKQSPIQVNDRGALDHVRPGDQQPVALSFSIQVNRVHALTGSATLYNAFTKTGPASTWTSVGATHEVYMVKVVFTVLDPTGGADNEVITFDRVFHEELSNEEGETTNMLAFSGVSHATAPTIT